ncbi:hypothetical protein [uncultured Gordonia sp.]|uniref:hypothetical protein n=1 Tax=uncultured Gordonia sp. TaxID=198437 RepID=UPI002589E937|nr:hypothetical protein [uncultured Gordonia sp.]
MKTVGAVGNRRSRRARTWAVRVSAVATLTAFSASAFTSNGTAAVINPALVPAPAPVAEKAAPKSPKAPEPETYQERIDRIAQSPRSLLAPLQENQGKATVCVSGEFTSLSVVYDSLFESLLPSLPPQLRQNAYAARDAAHRDMKRLNVSTLAISDNPMALGADSADPSMTYRGPVSQWIVTQLLKIRDGQENEAIPLGNITLTQAVETVWLYLFVTVVAPVKLAVQLTPFLGSPLTGTALDSYQGYFTYNTILQLAVQGGVLGSQYLYQGISNMVMNQCVARVTEDQREQAGRPSDDVTYHIDIPAAVRAAAGQLALADNDNCRQIGTLPLSRIVTRTGEYAQQLVTTDAQKQKIASETNAILAKMRATQVPHNLIPADPADFTQLESFASLVGSLIPYVGGAPLDITIGLKHNLDQGDNPFETVSVADLTVTKSLTAAYYSYYLSLYLFTTVGGLAEGQILGSPTVGFLSPTRAIGAVAALPLTYGLVNYHNVIRSMCLSEDDTTGTGRGAQVNRDNAVLPSASTTTPTVARPGRPSSSAPSSAPRRGASSPTSTPAPVIPGLPIRIPGIN